MGPPQEGKRMSGASSMSLEAHRPPRSTGLKPSRRASCSTMDLESEQSLQIRTWRRIKGTLPLFIAQFCISEANFPKTTQCVSRSWWDCKTWNIVFCSSAPPHLSASIMSSSLQRPRRHRVEALHHPALWEQLGQPLGVGLPSSVQSGGVADVHQHLALQRPPQPHQGVIVLWVHSSEHHLLRPLRRLPLRQQLHPGRKQTPGHTARLSAAHHHPEPTGHQPGGEGAGEVSGAHDGDHRGSRAARFWRVRVRTGQQGGLHVSLHDELQEITSHGWLDENYLILYRREQALMKNL